MTDRRARLDTLALAALLACVALWGLNQVAAKLALREFPPLMLAASRSAVAAACLAAWAAWRGIPLAPRRETLAGGLLAGLLFAAEFGCIFVGLQFTSASRMVVFIYLSPFFVALGMPWIAAAERLRRAQWLGLGVAFAGVALAFAEGFAAPAAGPRQWWGDALGLLAAALWGGTTLAIRATRLATAAPEQTLMYQLVVSGLALAAAALAAGEPWPAAVSPGGWGLLAFQGVVVTFASYLVWFWLVRHYAATQIAGFTLLTPVFGLLFGVGLLGEPLTARLLLALAAVAGGIGWMNRR